jgi:hypothetical protein
VTRLDRAFRSVVNALNTMAAFRKRGVHFRILNLPHATDDTPMGRFFFTVMVAVAELEREMIAERTRETLRTMRKQGRFISRHPPYGFKCIQKDFGRGPRLHLVPNRQERYLGSAVVRWKDEDRLSFEQIRVHLRDNKIKPRCGDWTPAKVSWLYRGEKALRLAEDEKQGG